MSGNSKIEWTEKTWNPIAAFTNRDLWVGHGLASEKYFDGAQFVEKGTRGWFCVKCSPGCANCYAEGINIRLGNGLTYTIRNLEFIEFRLVNLEDPLKWRKPRIVFVNSMTDLFLEHFPDEMIDAVFSVMAVAKEHTFQILTKRATRMEEYMRERLCLDQVHKRVAAEVGSRWLQISPCLGHLISDLEEGVDWPLPNVWLGVSVEDQERANVRIPLLLQTPAAIRFLSCEPLLESISLGGALESVQDVCGVHWVIVGGESGPKARPCDFRWILDIVNQCQQANVPVFVKQLGAKPFDSEDTTDVDLKDRKGGDPAEWPEDLRVREFPDCQAAVATQNV